MVDEDDIREMRREIEEIRDEVTDINHVQSLLARADERVVNLVLDYFRKGATETKVKFYLAADGTRSASEIADEVGIDPAQISRYGQEMTSQHWGILGVRWEEGRKIYHPTTLERSFHLSALLQDLVSD